MNAVCVFCGSSPGNRPEFVQLARKTGAAIAARGLSVVYGGGGRGMMGAVADGALEAGGEVIGVIPTWMVEKEAAHQGIQRMIEVETMLERKARMADLADAFLVLPGGLGTLDELFEMATWSQLHLHDRAKPIGILESHGYYAPLIVWLENAIREGFVPGSTPGKPHISSDTNDLLDSLAKLADS